MNEPWQLKCVCDNLKAIVPFQRQVRQVKDRVVTYRRQEGRDRNTIQEGLHMIDWLGNIVEAEILEIGTGWQPMIPILYSLAGARVYMADLHCLMRPDTFRAALHAIRENRDEISSRLQIAPDLVDRATRECLDLNDRLRELRLTYLAPCDCSRLDLDSATMDIVASRAVLEHVPPPVIEGIFREAKRILRPHGRMLHIVDYSDHWSHQDHRISAVNFLRYPDWLFRLTCMNPQNYQNRLRHSEYLAILESIGFKVTREESTIDPSCIAALSHLKVATRFRHFSSDDLASTGSTLLARNADETT
jgi:SAM-dependent methyltransferase